MVFAIGKHALSLCQRCGFQFKYLSMKTERGTLLRVCQECDDGVYNRVDHPQNHPPKKLTDAIGLKHPVTKPSLIVGEFEYAEANKEDIVDYVSIFLLTPED